LDDSLGVWLYLVLIIVQTQVNKSSSSREDLVLGSSSEPLVVLINMYKNRYGIATILVSMFGGCSES
jgi:hypothetical protein